ncbi:MAG TPA: hypothetical protein VE594_05700 [Nitrososphaeraceae archaeon]|nr:hypothetical protein [Nitrososphaeraceae archaeon]
MNFVKKHSVEKDVIALLKSLNDTVLYHNIYSVKQVLEQENSVAKQDYQISDETRKKGSKD